MTLIASDGCHYLATLDDNQYCIIQLPRKSRTVADAINALKPRQVLDAEATGVDVKRQGEWFFVPLDSPATDKSVAASLGMTQTLLCKRSKPRPLPKQHAESNDHTCRWIECGRQILATGLVRHPEHRSVKLDSWHVVYKNREIRSWVRSGAFD